MKENTSSLTILTKMSGNIGCKKSITIFGASVTDDQWLIDLNKAQKFFNIILKNLKEGYLVVLDLKGIGILHIDFANVCFGQLVEELNVDFLRKNLKFKNVSSEDAELISKVMKNAIKYFNK